MARAARDYAESSVPSWHEVLTKTYCRTGRKRQDGSKPRNSAMGRILFLVPHPDDEIVAAAATIAARVAAGDSIFAL